MGGTGGLSASVFSATQKRTGGQAASATCCTS